jgi:predicted glycogen debranching enzyme
MEPRIQLDRSVCGNRDIALGREWLETNGLGGYASETISGAHTRRYHGLLMAATNPPVVRYLLLSKIEEALICADQRYELSSNYYPGVVYPEGYRHLRGFRLDPFPIFTFEAGGVEIEKRVFLVQGENTVVIEYETRTSAHLELRPLIAFRVYHALTYANPAMNGSLDIRDDLVSIRPYPGLPRFWFAHNAQAVRPVGEWYFNFEYPIERERGFEFREDLFCPFVLECDTGAGEPIVVVASTTEHSAKDSGALKSQEIKRRAQTVVIPSAQLPAAAAEQFVAHRGTLRTIIAGYPWFTDWGRDTMISLTGLTLVTGRYDIARGILLAFAGCLDQGMLPNRFPDYGDTPEYNTVDATLWFFEAVRNYLEYTNDLEFIEAHLYGKLKEIIEWHLRGTRFGIHVDEDGLVSAGDSMTQLTWMDARNDGRPVTPRNGKPVEIQALWYNALRFIADLAMRFEDEPMKASCEGLAARAAKGINELFWNENAGCLYDVVDGDARDDSLRPNQVIALSLGYCAIPEDRARRILAAVEQHLLTPFGLRTLAPFDLRYHGRYEGSPVERNAAYHQGAVWPWLLGHYINAQIRFNGLSREEVMRLLDPLRNFMESEGTGQLPEIFDGDAPHKPRGCFAQAWSVAELLRITAGKLA